MSAVRVATVTFSDTRTEADDDGGRLLVELLGAAGFVLHGHQIVREDLAVVRAAIDALLSIPDVDAIVTTGGTGLAERDVAVQAIEPLFDRPMTGFGEAFRRLSWDEVGARAVLSNATAGVARKRIVIALPGSPKAVRLGIEKLVAPMLAHAVAIARGSRGAPSHPRGDA